MRNCAAALLAVAGFTAAELPPSLPGEEITDNILNMAIAPDTAKNNAVKTGVSKPAVQWFDKTAKTWEAPSLSEQMSKDRTTIPIGKGGIFVPRMTELHREPDIEIIDSTGKSVADGEPGVTYSVEPGKYFVMLGSGAHKQRIVRHVEVTELKNTPVLPDWAGLIIETVDTNATPFKGEYELVRIDEFEPFGRGYGADVSLGEAVKAWVLKPGIYKILGRGENYNTLKNFVTIRLLPGEMTRMVLIEREEDLAIMGGGNVDLTTGKKIASNWKYGGSIGGNVQFVNNIDSKEDRKTDYYSMLSMTTSLWTRYLRSPIEWESSIALNEGFNLSQQNSSSLLSFQSATDEFKVRSLFIWRFLKWLGPYGSSELKTNLLQKNIQREDKDYFLILRSDTVDISTLSTSTTHKLNPSFSPFIVDVGGGVNVDALNVNFLDVAVRLGGGSTYTSFPDKYTEVLKSKVVYDSSEAAIVDKSVLLRFEKRTDVVEFGPLGLISADLRIGRLGSASIEAKVFAPLYPENRFSEPDFDFSSVLSWRIANGVTLDYIFSYQLKQPAEEDAQVDLATNTVLLRFSFSSR